MPIHQEIAIDANVKDVFKALTDSNTFSNMTGAPAEIDAQNGGAFSGFDGQVSGRFIEIVPNDRIVQAWRVGMWDPGVYSVVTMKLEDKNGRTQLSLVHDGYPEPMEVHLDAGWDKMYWGPMRAHF